MKIYEYGKENNKTILCLPGNFMTHRQFENIVPMLENNYRVLTVSFDGYDETGKTVYTTAKKQAEKLADYIRKNLNGRIDLIYAESLGSIPGAWLTQIKDISIGGVILSGAEYMSYGIFNKPVLAIFVPFTYKLMNKMIKSGNVKFPKFLQIKMGITNDTFKPMLKQACQKLTLETTKATFWEAVRMYPEYVDSWKPDPDIPVACWYGEKEMNMKKAVKHLKRAFPKLQIHVFKGMGHGENMRHTELTVRELKAFMMKNS
ncbi:MAG: alpha/beta hydrolase [Oscillospiraceae bacterium]|nr:alpha/beta hydrolase [Oscillospiraceae bacterium]